MNRSGRLVIDGRRLTAERTGVGRYLETLLRGWDESGWPLDEVVLVLSDRSGLPRVPRATSLQVEVIGERWPGLLWEWMALGRLLRRGDILFAPTNLIPAPWRGPTVLVVFDTLLEALPDSFSRSVRWRFRGRYRRAARRATRLLVPSDAAGRDVARFFEVDPAKIVTIYPSIGPEFRPRDVDDPLVVAARRAVGLPTEPFFLFVGKRSNRRNVGAILDAFQRHRQRWPSHRLVFVGPEGGTAIPPGQQGVTVAGHVADEVLHGLLSGALACLYPSDHEGFGLPVVEAMASGCPVITLRTGALIESGGVAACFIESAAPAAIEAAMNRLAGGSEARSEHVRLGLIQAERFRGPGFARAVGDAIRAEAVRSGLVASPRGG